jgi:hypothetical protein
MSAHTAENVRQASADAVTPTTATTPTIPTAARPARATLQTRPRVQRVCIRSWEYVRPVRITLVVIRLLVVVWLFVLANLLVSNGIVWGWTLLPAAVAVVAIRLWVFKTAEKGWPVAGA